MKTKNLKIVHIHYKTTTASPDTRLHQAFLKEGIKSSIITLISHIDGDELIKSAGRNAKWTAKIDTWIQSKKTRKVNRKLGSFSYPVIGTDLSKWEVIKEADVIYVHWALNGFMSHKNVKQLADLNKPIILYMHDMWTITGGCHYSLDCDKYKTSCNNCPMLEGSEEHDLSSKEFDRKMKFYSSYDNLYFVTPSKWLYECTKQSALTRNKPVFHIPNTLDKSIFKPYDKNVAKEILNFSPDEIVIAFGAIAVNSPYKGWNYLQEALQLLYNEEERMNISVLIFGSGYNKVIADAIPFKTKFAGFLNSDYATSLMYNAADVFLAPSLADNFPYTVFEAQSCGTPVTAFRIGGIPEFIDHKANGYLADYKDAEDLARGIKYCVDSKIKGYRLKYLEPEVVLEKYIDLMETILSHKA